MHRAAALTVARWARERVPLYRDLYADAPPIERWADFRHLPVLTRARLRAAPLGEQVDTLDDTLRSQTAFALQSVATPRTLVLDADDTDTVFEQTRVAFALAGVRRGARIVVVAPPAQRYVAAEAGDQLGYFGIEVHVVIALDSVVVMRTLDALAPARPVFLGPPVGQQAAITVRQPWSDGADLYLVPEAGIVAVRPAGETAYRLLRRFSLLESAPDGRLLLTMLRRYHQPLIRYELADRGRIAGGRLWLDEVAP